MKEQDQKKAPDYQVGDTVKIISGEFENFLGVVFEVMPDRSMVKVYLTIFGRKTGVEFGYAQIEKVK